MKKAVKHRVLKWEGAPRDVQLQGPRFRIRLMHVLPIIKHFHPENMLEIGAGNGNMAMVYKDYVGKLLLTDASPKAVKLLKERFKEKENINVKRLNILKDKLKGGFDFVLLSEVLEHIREDERFLKEISKLLMEEGVLLITVPANERYRGEEDNKAGHIRRYSYERIRALLHKADFRIIRFIGWGYPIMALYYKYYNKRYYGIKKQGKLKGFVIRTAVPFIYGFELLFKKAYNRSLGFIILARKVKQG